MPKVKKDNRILTVEKERLETFLSQGYDEIDDKGEVVKRATGGRVVNIQEYNKLAEQLEGLKKENTALKAKVTRLEKTTAK